MTAIANRPIRRAAMAVALSVLAGSAAFAQKAPALGTHITVSKTATPSDDNPDVGMFRTIQDAVNAATNGQVIEILDTEVYEEQVTIDGRDVSPWDGHNGGSVKKVVGKKNGITIRYVPSAAEKARGNYKRPTIKYKDTQNQSPKNYRPESENSGELPGSSGNFETCGALRIIRAQGVTIDGIAVDGGGPAPFGWKQVWSGKDPLIHGNAAITLVVAGGAVIRNCDLKNAFIGLNVKDRNTGGVFGMRNPSDPDDPVPLSGFGKVGYHLIEYNRIHDNSLGFFFESAWDLGSTVRYNLIYNNFHTDATKSIISKFDVDDNDKKNMAGGAAMFKDMVYSPVAIYNNTFYNNYMNFIGHWKVGAPHLIFNNIFGKSAVKVTSNGGQQTNFGNVDFMSLESAFQYRMHNSIFSSYLEIAAQGQEVYVDNSCNPQRYDTLWIRDATVWNQFAKPEKSSLSIRFSYCANAPPHVETAVLPGALLIEGGATAFPRSANVRWLETSKVTVTAANGSAKSLVLPDLFQSTDTANPKFLWPDWDHQYVKDYITNKGWQSVGIRNADNQIADLGAISSNNDIHQPTLVRIKPTNVVLLNGTSAKASFFLTLESGTMANPKIKFIRWVAPLPNAYSNFGYNESIKIPQDAIRDVTLPTAALSFGSNTFDFTIPSMNIRDSLFGFFEVVVEGTGANGQTVSDVGFLPYRNLDYKLDIRVFAANAASTTGKGIDTVRAGEPYKVVVTPQRSNGTSVNYNLNEVTYDLLSDPTAFMYNTPVKDKPDNPLTADKNLPSAGKTYEVYFTHAGAETIMGAGVYDQGANHLVFLGTKDLVVRPGSPDNIVFIDPIPTSQLSGAPPPVISRGVDREVLVEVRDKYGNAVDVPVQVKIESDHPDIGDAGASSAAMNNKTVTTAGTTGVATFIAKAAASAASGQIFELTASFTSGSASGEDRGKLRVGRALDRLEVFYSDTGSAKKWSEYYDPDVKIEGSVGDWFRITVKVVVGDTVNTGRQNQYILVSPGDDNLIFSASSGGAPATVFPINGGVARFWVSTAPGTNRDVEGGLTVYALRTQSEDDIDQSIQSGGRDNIIFKKLSTSISYAVVYGDGQGRPDSAVIRYNEGGVPLTGPGAAPSKVTLNWGGAVLTAADIKVVNDVTLRATFTGARPSGYTFVTGMGRGLAEVTGAGGAVETDFDVYDGVGPVLANGNPNDGAGAGPRIYENLDGGPDTLIITVSEDLRDPTASGKLKLLYTPPGADPGEPGANSGRSLDVLSVSTANGRTFTVVVRHTADGPIPGGWIRLDPAAAADLAAAQSGGVVTDNKPHDSNRWVQLRLQQQTPEIKGAWYTGNNAAGKPDYLYVLFNKEIDDVNGWFIGGSVKVENAPVVTIPDAAAIQSLFSVAEEGRALKINLSAAAPSIAVSGPIRTSGDMQFQISFAPGAWKNEDGNDDPNLTVTLGETAKDRAAPVLAKAAVLKTGSMKDPKDQTEGDGDFNKDTLTVYYSEKISEASHPQSLRRPLTLILKNVKSQPELELLGTIVYDGETRLYRARYVVLDKLDPKPAIGDSVQIYHSAGIGDDVDAANVQGDAENKRQPIVIDRSSNWTAKVKKNPFVSGGGQDSMVVAIWANVDGAEKVSVKARIRVFDNIGSVVVDTTVVKKPTDSESDRINWTWRGQNTKGRLVGSGIYLFKALCESEVDGQKDQYKVEKRLGVVRGKK